MGEIIKLDRIDNIAIITMEEQNTKNSFTAQFLTNLIDAFGAINDDHGISVVVLTGYDNYFCCGGLKQDLEFKIASGKAVFEKDMVYDLLLKCNVPVISAMQGHALGAGFVLGLYADIVYMGEQCLYSANFMNYDFTPGFGATYIIPKKMGHSLGCEMLYSAKSYYGSELKQRGANINIVDKSMVVKEALKMANILSKKSRLPLTILKSHLNEETLEQLPDYIKKELDMHKATLYQPGVIQKIKNSSL